MRLQHIQNINVDTQIYEFGFMKCEICLFVAILENGHHLGFLIGQFYRMDLITIQMSHAMFGDCITTCTICSTLSVTT